MRTILLTSGDFWTGAKGISFRRRESISCRGLQASPCRRHSEGDASAACAIRRALAERMTFLHDWIWRRARSILRAIMRFECRLKSDLAIPNWKRALCSGAGLLFLLAHSTTRGQSADVLPTGKALTPAAAAGSTFQYLNPHNPLAPGLTVNGAAAVAVSPDGRWLAILTSGYNTFADQAGTFPPELSTEYLFVFDIRENTPKQVRAFPIRTTLQGLSWAPSSHQVYVSGGTDDRVLEFITDEETFHPGRTFLLGHRTWVGGPPDALGGKGCGCAVSAVSVSPDGRLLLAANYMNDSASLIDLASGRVVAEQDLRPGIIDKAQRGRPGG